MSRIALDLVSDGAVRLVLDRPLYSLAERWIPQGLREPAGVPARATISVCGGQAPLGAPAERATVSLDRVAAWVDDAHATAVLRGAIPSSGGVLSFAARHARLQVDPARAQEAAADLYSLLTVAAALLLADLGRALVHAAAVVAPDGGLGSSPATRGRASPRPARRSLRLVGAICPTIRWSSRPARTASKSKVGSGRFTWTRPGRMGSPPASGALCPSRGSDWRGGGARRAWPA